MVRSSKWSGHSPFKAGMHGSSPVRITIRCLRLIGQDASLSSWRCGFESRRHHHMSFLKRRAGCSLRERGKRGAPAGSSAPCRALACLRRNVDAASGRTQGPALQGCTHQRLPCGSCRRGRLRDCRTSPLPQAEDGGFLQHKSSNFLQKSETFSHFPLDFWHIIWYPIIAFQRQQAAIRGSPAEEASIRYPLMLLCLPVLWYRDFFVDANSSWR